MRATASPQKYSSVQAATRCPAGATRRTAASRAGAVHLPARRRAATETSPERLQEAR